MSKYIIILSTCIMLVATSCNKLLDRPPLTVANDENVWTNEDNVRLYANKYYPSFFTGYGVGFSTESAALMGYTFSDDILYRGNQSNFTRAVPNSAIWGMGTIRSTNIMIDRLQNRMKGVLSEEAYAHWMGIARFFRALDYSQLVLRFGDVPYYDHVVKNTNPDDLYKDRTPRDEVMDSLYKDFKYAMNNVRTDDGDQNVNKYVVAGFVSRIALYEGTWQKYYYNNPDRAKKFLTLAGEAGDIVMQSGKFDIVNTYKGLFTSLDLSGNKGVILHRHYDDAVGITHSIATECNLLESLAFGPTSDLIKSYICNDGEVWQNSTVNNPSDFSDSNMVKTRDSRFEASFHRKPMPMNKASYLYITKFLPRAIEKIDEEGGTPPTIYLSDNNITDYPVMRYAEVLLNWIEAKAELATLGGDAVTQADLDNTINKLRNRPLDQEAEDRGVQKTAALLLASLPNDPDRDPSVPALIWEIRRERRMEFAFEHSRYEDLRRWYQLDNMDTDDNPDLLSGGWVDFPKELPDALDNKTSVVKIDGSIVEYNGSNDANMVGFYRNMENNGRLPFIGLGTVNPYLDPVGKVQIDDYEAHGYKLSQTEGWPQN